MIKNDSMNICFGFNTTSLVVQNSFVQPFLLARSGGSRTVYKPSFNCLCRVGGPKVAGYQSVGSGLVGV